jgi:hypothetical protein
VKHLTLILLLLLTTKTSFAQISVSPDAQLTYNKHSDQFFLLDDSTCYYTQKPGSKRWVKHAYVYAGGVAFEEMRARTHVLAMSKDRYYFVHEGCGSVYELYHDTLKRIDESFHTETSMARRCLPGITVCLCSVAMDSFK